MSATDEPSGPAALPEVRASDNDRDRVLGVLRAAVGDGRLTADGFEERMTAAMSSRTLGELAVLTGDLVTGAGPATPQAEDAVIIDDTLRVDMKMRGGSLILAAGPGIVVDADSLTVRYNDVEIRPRADPGVPVSLHVRLAGRTRYGRIEVRPRL